MNLFIEDHWVYLQQLYVVNNKIDFKNDVSKILNLLTNRMEQVL